MLIRGYDTKHTIAAVATFPSTAALGIVKVSGKDALSIVSRNFLPKNKNKDIKRAKSYTLHYGWVIQPSEGHAKRVRTKRESKIVDEVLVSVMRAPYSYTREDVVEISSHGGVLILNKILDLILKSGARLAKPGEFSYRAFLNGRLDAIQLQAIADIVRDLGIKRLVIDSITSVCYQLRTEEKIRQFILKVGKSLSEYGCTSILVSEISPSSERYSLYGVEEAIADGIILMGNLQRRGDLLRTLQVVKMRGTNHSRAKYVLDLTPSGVLLVPLLKGGSI